MMERLRRRREAEQARPQAGRDEDPDEYGRHVHHEGDDRGEFRYLPCLCNRPHSHRKPA